MKVRAAKTQLEKLIKGCNFYKFKSYSFSHIYNNFPAVLNYYSNGKNIILDSNPPSSNLTDEFLNTNWVTKQEIPTKIKILNTFSSLKEVFSIQKLFKHKKMINLDETILRYMYEGGYLDRNYFLNILFEKNEIDLNKEIMDKIVMNGYVFKYFDNDEYDEYNKVVDKVKKLVNIFYVRQELTDLEKIVQTIYLNDKFKNYSHYRSTKNADFFCIYTDNDYMASNGFIWLPESEFKKNNFNISRFLESFDFNKYLETIILMRKLNKSRLGLMWNALLTNEFYFKNIQKTKVMAYLILCRMFVYLQSEEFTRAFDCELDFYIFNGIVSLHLWMICQRLQNFKRSKFSSDLIDEILKLHKSHSHREFQQVDALRKISKFKNIQEIYEDQKNTLHMHFNIYNPTVENNYFKIDSLVWSHIFREKIPRYDDRVYKMSHYIIHHVNKFKNYTLDDFEHFNVNFDLNCIPFNVKDQIILHNEQLTPQNLFKEKYSDLILKKYYYEYKTEKERGMVELKKTFIRHTHLTTFDKRNYNLRSRRKVDDIYDELKDNERVEEYNEKFVSEFESMDHSGSILNKLFERWAAKHYKESIETCEREDLRRAREEYNEKNIKIIGKDERVRFSEKLDKTLRENLYTYRDLLNTNSKATEEGFKQTEMKILNPDANVVTYRKKRKPLVDKIFNLKPY